MGERDRKRSRLGRAYKTVQHSAAYVRNLAKGNHFAGDLSWTKPGTLPVVLAHGFMGTRGTMVPLTQRFQSDGRVVFSYHHGTFQLRSLRASAQQLVDHLNRLERELGVTKVDMVGFSMGGLIALHAVKFLQAHRWIRRLALLGTPSSGTWVGLAGVGTVGWMSPSVWQVLPTSPFLRDLRDAPMPEGVRVRQISAAQDAFCPLPDLLTGVDKERDYVVLPGGHSSMVVSQKFYAQLRGFFEEKEPGSEDAAPQRGDAGIEAVRVESSAVDHHDDAVANGDAPVVMPNVPSRPPVTHVGHDGPGPGSGVVPGLGSPGLPMVEAAIEPTDGDGAAVA